MYKLYYCKQKYSKCNEKNYYFAHAAPPYIALVFASTRYSLSHSWCRASLRLAIALSIKCPSSAPTPAISPAEITPPSVPKGGKKSIADQKPTLEKIIANRWLCFLSAWFATALPLSLSLSRRLFWWTSWPTFCAHRWRPRPPHQQQAGQLLCQIKGDR